MSTQSIIHNTDSKIATQISNFLKEASIKHLLKTRFDIGTKLVYSDIRKITRLYKIFCEDSCMLDQNDFTKIKEEINSILIYNTPEL